jgi:hypothetical protein
VSIPTLLVAAVSVETVQVARFGAAEPDIVSGRTTVTFDLANGQSFDLDWSHAGEPPSPGSKWKLVPEVAS